MKISVEKKKLKQSKRKTIDGIFRPFALKAYNIEFDILLEKFTEFKNYFFNMFVHTLITDFCRRYRSNYVKGTKIVVDMKARVHT